MSQAGNAFGSAFTSAGRWSSPSGTSARASTTTDRLSQPDRVTPFGGGSYMQAYEVPFDISYQAAAARGWAKVGAPGTSVNPIGGGQTGSLRQSGRFDEANGLIAQTGARWGVPPAVLKAIINRESSGDWNRNGSRYPQIRPGPGGRILPYVGIFANAWSSWGCPGSADQAVGNQAAQVDCLARGLRRFYDRSPTRSWESVAAMHFSGQWDPNSGWADENGMTVRKYVGSFMREVSMFGDITGNAPAGGAPMAGGSGGIATVWGGQGSKNLSYGFLAPNNLGLYAYGRNYGTDGRGHTGIDIPMPLNAPVYTPVSGTVVCACTGSGGGCSAFNDVMGSGCGRIEIQTPQGHRVILGHTSRGMVQIGQQVSVGQQVATNGGMNGAHVHLEYRVPDQTMPAGYRLVDPAQYLGGGAAPVSGAPGVPLQGQQPVRQPMPWETRTWNYRPIAF